MARQLTQEQVDSVKEALSAIPDMTEPADLVKVASALRDSKQTAFSEADLVSLEDGIALLQQPLEEKPTWSATKDRGSFIVFEGLDRSGKSTQSRLLREHLEKSKGADAVRWMCFPNRDTAIGCVIDLYLRRQVELSDGAIHLLFSANRWEMAAAIVEHISRGTTVVCDRYAFSGVAYTAAKGLDFEWCQAPDRGLPCPDAVFFMRVEPEDGAARANFGDERYENLTMQANVRAEFQNGRLHDGVNWNVVDGGRAIDEISEEIKEKVSILQAAAGEEMPVVQLWLA